MNFIPYFSINEVHTESISSLCFSNPSSSLSSPLIASSSNDKYISIYKLLPQDKKTSLYWSYKYHLNGINKIKFNKDNVLLCSGGNDLSINITDINKQNLCRNFRSESIITSLDINSTSNLIVGGTYDNCIVLFDVRSRNLVVKIISHSEPITSVAFSDDSTVIVTTSYDGFCRVWDVFKFVCLKTIVLENSPALNSCVILPNEDYLMLSSFNNQIEIVDIVTEEEIKKFGGYKHMNYLVDCGIYKSSKEENFIVSGDEEGNICYWDVKGEENCKKVNVQGIEEEGNKDDVDMMQKKWIVNTLDVSEGLLGCACTNDKTNSIYFYKEDYSQNEMDK